MIGWTFIIRNKMSKYIAFFHEIIDYSVAWPKAEEQVCIYVYIYPVLSPESCFTK